jgi:hypothetical protein
VARSSPLERVRRLCLALPETTERPSHGAPAFFVRGKRSFLMYMDDHHGDGRLALWCAAPPGAQRTLVAARPEHFFVPPYVGYRGWLGVRLDRDLGWAEIARLIEDAYLTVAPKSLAAALHGGREERDSTA